MKKIILFAFIVAVLMTVPVQAASNVPGVSASCAVVMDAQSGLTLYEKNADDRMLVASTTKIMTALIVIERCRLDDVVAIKPEWTGIEGSSIYLKVGERITVRDLLYGLMLESGNDAAVALACHAAGSVDKFARLMNEKAAELGLTNTSFRNPHGLDADDHYSCARDLAALTAEAMSYDEFIEISSTKTINVAGRLMKNHNKLLWECDGVIGGKTGFTKSAGRILVSFAERDGLKLVCVTIKAPDDWRDHASLYSWAYSSYRRDTVVSSEATYAEIPVVSGDVQSVKVRAKEDISVLVDGSDNIEISVELPRFVYADIVEGDTAGYIVCYVNGWPAAQTELIYEESVGRVEGLEPGLWNALKKAMKDIL